MIVTESTDELTSAEPRQSARLRVRSRRPLSTSVMELVLESSDNAPLPEWAPGAHIGVRVGDGTERQYSLCGDPEDRRAYRIGVQREADGRGGSRWMHEAVASGDALEISGPRNNFELVDAREYRLVAGGIGITPILSMVAALQARGAQWQLIYLGRERERMAFLSELERYGARVMVHVDEERGACDLQAAIGEPQPGTAVYACGPEPMLRAVESIVHNWPSGALHLERFVAPTADPAEVDRAFEVELAGSGEVFSVPPGTSILQVLEDAGKRPLFSCREGTCGTCESVIVDGEADHRDSILSSEEREANESMMICVSRAQSPRIVLDL